MSKIANWLIEMEEAVDTAVVEECLCLDDVMSFCERRLEFVDRDVIKAYLEESYNY